MTDVAALGYEVDTRGLRDGERALDRFAKANDGTGNRVERMSRRIRLSFSSIAGAIAGAFAGREIIQSISGFETSMSRVAAISGATDMELRRLRDTALELGSTTEFSASQAADGLGFLAMAGFDASEAVAAIPDVLDLATASGMGLANAADIATNIMGSFGVGASNTSAVTDILAAAASSANTNVAQLGRAITGVGSIAAGAGISLEDTAAAIGVLSNQGIQGERAGTALRGVLASLAGPSTQAEEALRRYGLTAADVNPDTRELADIMATLEQANLSTADAIAIFGREASAGALILANSSDELRTLGDELTRVDGASSDMAETMRDNLGGDIEGLKSSVQGLILAMGDAGLTAILRFATQTITDFVRGVSVAVEKVQEYQGYIVAAGAAIAAYYTPAVVAAIFQTGAWVASLIKLKGALIASGIGAAVVAAGFLVNEFIKLVRATGSVGEAFKVIANVANEVFTQRIPLVLSFLGVSINQSWQNIKSSVFQVLADIVDGMGQWANNGIGIFVGAKDAIIAAFSMLPQAFRSLGAKAINGLSEVVSSGIQRILGPINAILEATGGSPITISLGNMVNDPEMPDVGAAVSSAFSSAMSQNYIGDMSSSLSEMASKAASRADMSGDIAGSIMNMTTAPLDSLSELRTALEDTGEVAGSTAEQVANAVNGTPGGASIGGVGSVGGGAVGGSGGGRSGMGGGGGGMTGEAPLTALERLLGTDEDEDPYAAVESWYNEALTALADSQLRERGLIEQHQSYLTEIERIYAEQRAEIKRQERDQTLSHYQSFFGEMSGALQSGGEKMLKISKAFGVAEAIVSMWRGAAKALELPFPANLAAWAKVLATGMTAINGIKGAKPGGGGSSSGGASVAGSQSAAMPSAPLDRRVMVSVDGPDWIKGMIQPVMEQIYDATQDGQKVIFE